MTRNEHGAGSGLTPGERPIWVKVFPMGRPRPGPRKHGPARQPACPCLARPAPVPVSGLPIRPMGQHGARHGKVAWPANGPLSRDLSRPIPPDGLWPLDPGQRRRHVYKPAGLHSQTLNHFIISLANALPPLLSGSRPLRRRWRRATAPPKGDGDSPSSPRTPPPLLVLQQPQLWSSDDAGNIPFCSSSSFSHCH